MALCKYMYSICMSENDNIVHVFTTRKRAKWIIYYPTATEGGMNPQYLSTFSETQKSNAVDQTEMLGSSSKGDP